jgi:hypothetical protein
VLEVEMKGHTKEWKRNKVGKKGIKIGGKIGQGKEEEQKRKSNVNEEKERRSRRS